MFQSRTTILCLLLLAIIVEFLLKSSNISFLVNLNIVVIIASALLFAGQKRNALIYLLLSTVFIEVFNYNLLGITALIFLVSSLLVTLVFKIVSLLGDDRHVSKIVITNLIFILFKNIYITSVGGAGTNLKVISVLFNIALLLVVIELTQKLISTQNVYKKFK